MDRRDKQIDYEPPAEPSKRDATESDALTSGTPAKKPSKSTPAAPEPDLPQATLDPGEPTDVAATIEPSDGGAVEPQPSPSH